jgi:hypothetical protein
MLDIVVSIDFALRNTLCLMKVYLYLFEKQYCT